MNKKHNFRAKILERLKNRIKYRIDKMRKDCQKQLNWI